MNRYTLTGQIGDGTFGIVLKGIQNNTGEVVAVKRMKQHFHSWEECLQLREITSPRRLQHPNMIKLKEVVREKTELNMVFEFMEQNILQLSRGRQEKLGNVPNLFDEKEIRSIMAQTLLGLQAVHKGGFMHRDLKPENLLTKGDVVKIADFGLAKEIRSRPPFTTYVSTRWYRAPELVLRSTNYNSPIDIWAAGVIFAELYMNRPLFPGSSDPDQLFKICAVLGTPTAQEWDDGHQLARKMNMRFPNTGTTPLRSFLGNISPAAYDLIESMLRFNPQDRPTASQCLSHPFFTGDGTSMHSGGAPSSALFSGIVTGQPHNPFHWAMGVPNSSTPQQGNSSFPTHPSLPGNTSSGNSSNGPRDSSGFPPKSPSPTGSPPGFPSSNIQPQQKPWGQGFPPPPGQTGHRFGSNSNPSSFPSQTPSSTGWGNTTGGGGAGGGGGFSGQQGNTTNSHGFGYTPGQFSSNPTNSNNSPSAPTFPSSTTGGQHPPAFNGLNSTNSTTTTTTGGGGASYHNRFPSYNGATDQY